MSFIEVLIAVALLMIGMAALFSLSTHMLRMNALAGNVSAAMAKGQSRLERLQAEPYAAVAAGTETTNGFTVAWTVATNAMPIYKKIQVAVSWNDIDGRPHKVKLKGLVSE